MENRSNGFISVSQPQKEHDVSFEKSMIEIHLSILDMFPIPHIVIFCEFVLRLEKNLLSLSRQWSVKNVSQSHIERMWTIGHRSSDRNFRFHMCFNVRVLIFWMLFSYSRSHQSNWSINRMSFNFLLSQRIHLSFSFLCRSISVLRRRHVIIVHQRRSVFKSFWTFDLK